MVMVIAAFSLISIQASCCVCDLWTGHVICITQLEANVCVCGTSWAPIGGDVL